MISAKIKNLIAKKLANQCTTEESSDLGHWLQLSERNHQVFRKYELAWKYTNKAVATHQPDADQAWKALKNRIKRLDKQEVNFHPGRKTYLRKLPMVARIAAMLVLGLAAWFMFKPEPKPETIQLVATEKANEATVLPDGTKVYLNEGSHLSYNTDFNSGHRHIQFEGEAYFEVAANEETPFVISTQNLGIRVLGTSFNLSSFEHKDDVVLHLQTGKLAVYSLNANGEPMEQMVLHPGEKSVYNKTTAVLSRESFETLNFLSWKTGVLEFNNAPLSEVLDALSKAYGLRFVAEHDCSNFLLTARFEQETTESILQTIGFVFNLNISDEGDFIRIY